MSHQCNCSDAINSLRSELTQKLNDIQTMIITQLNENLSELRNSNAQHNEKLDDHSNYTLTSHALKIESLQIEQKSILENVARLEESLAKTVSENLEMTRRLAELETKKPNITTHTIQSSKTQKNVKPALGTETDLSVVVYGIKESELENHHERFNELKNETSHILDQLKCSLENNVTNFQRMGKYSPQKNRPVILKLNSVWTKRKMLSEYENLKKSGSLLNFKMSTYRNRTGAHSVARKKAWEMNEAEKQSASSENRTITTSYSAQPNGEIYIFQLSDNKWGKTGIITSDTSNAKED